MDILHSAEKCDELLSDASREWLIQIPSEVSLLWIPSETSINDELL